MLSSYDTAIWRMRYQAYSEAQLREIVARGDDYSPLAFGVLVARGLEVVRVVED